ncbi:hypothetical protein M422DRAFT_180787, partial [Sphaerobolus stellatus SS14]
MLNGDADQHEKARSLITKFVNHMTTHMQIGSPMAAAYLLGLPDHYSSHSFKPLYWRQYYMQMNIVRDYIYQPLELANVCLYDWINQYDKVRSRNNTNATSHSTEAGSGDLDELQVGSDELDENDPQVPEELSEVENTSAHLLFIAEHPHCDRYYVKKLPEAKWKVPNFLGGALPKQDGPDPLYYSLTMLTLFKPWRTGEDLKLHSQSWSEAFTDFEFSAQQLEHIKYFNIKHECYDALDDFHTQRQQSDTYPNKEGQLLTEIDSSWFGFDEEINDQDQLNIEAATEEYEKPNGSTFKRLDEMLQTEIRLREASW